jgi:hypothetical protein
VRVRVDVDGEPLAPGAAVSGRVIVEEGGRARVDRAGPDPTVDRPIELLRGYTAPD